MDISSRDAAVLTWTAVITIWMLSRRGVWPHVLGVLRSAAAPKLLALGAAFTIYAGAEVVLLHRLGMWHVGLIKATLLWFAFTAVAAGFNGLSSDPALMQAARNGLGIAVAAELLFGTVTFSYPLELFIIGAGTLLALFAAVTSVRVEDGDVHRAVSKATAAFGLAVAAAIVLRTFAAPPQVKFFQLVSEFLTPVVLSLLFIPAAKAAGVVAKYEWLFGHLRLLRNGSFRSKLALCMYLGVDKARVLEFGRAQMWLLHDASNFEDISRIISSDRADRAAASGLRVA